MLSVKLLVISTLYDVFTCSGCLCLRWEHEGRNCKGSKCDILKWTVRWRKMYFYSNGQSKMSCSFRGIHLWPMFARPYDVINLNDCGSAVVLQSFVQALLHFHSVTFCKSVEVERQGLRWHTRTRTQIPVTRVFMLRVFSNQWSQYPSDIRRYALWTARQLWFQACYHKLNNRCTVN
jgi:hypothetical protein